MDTIQLVLIEGVRVLFIIGLPLIAASVGGGFVASLLQTFLAMKEPSALYAGRVGAVAIALYLMSPLIYKSLQDLISLSLSAL